jgi:hypothetical protein
MSAKLIKKGAYAVGVTDWNERHFHGYTYCNKKRCHI